MPVEKKRRSRKRKTRKKRAQYDSSSDDTDTSTTDGSDTESSSEDDSRRRRRKKSGKSGKRSKKKSRSSGIRKCYVCGSKKHEAASCAQKKKQEDTAQLTVASEAVGAAVQSLLTPALDDVKSQFKHMSAQFSALKSDVARSSNQRESKLSSQSTGPPQRIPTAQNLPLSGTAGAYALPTTFEFPTLNHDVPTTMQTHMAAQSQQMPQNPQWSGFHGFMSAFEAHQRNKSTQQTQRNTPTQQAQHSPPNHISPQRQNTKASGSLPSSNFSHTKPNPTTPAATIP